MFGVRHKIAILADSTAIPRDGTKSIESYPGLLMKEGYIVFDLSEVRATTDSIVRTSYSERFRSLDCEYYIIQVGICDCTPRIFTQRMNDLLAAFDQFNGLKKISKFIRKKKNKYLEHTKNKLIQNVSSVNFYNNLKFIISIIMNRAPNLQKIIFINIVNPGQKMIDMCFNIQNIIIEYNNYIKSFESPFVNIIDLHSMSSNFILTDGHHINSLGHYFIYNEIRKII